MVLTENFKCRLWHKAAQKTSDLWLECGGTLVASKARAALGSHTVLAENFGRLVRLEIHRLSVARMAVWKTKFCAMWCDCKDSKGHKGIRKKRWWLAQLVGCFFKFLLAWLSWSHCPKNSLGCKKKLPKVMWLGHMCIRRNAICYDLVSG